MWPWALIAGLLFTAGSDAQLRVLLFENVSAAWLQVSVFVALTLGLFYASERFFRIDIMSFLARRRRVQVVVASFLGALPGCGGAVIVATQFVRGSLSFGALTATLTATMGDAAFLLLAQQPLTGALVIGLGLVTGILSGWIVDFLGWGRTLQSADVRAVSCSRDGVEKDVAGLVHGVGWIWLFFFATGLVFGVASLLQIDADSWFGSFASWKPATFVGFFGASLAMVLFACKADRSAANLHTRHRRSTLGSRIIEDTNFVTTWVVMGFLAYELVIYAFHIDPQTLLQGKESVVFLAPLLPLLGILVGFLPGCGPQIVVTSLYLSNALPLSAQVGNAIANDGDALFPVLSLAPRAALLATLVSAVPALLVGYGLFFLTDLH